ncbi:hypothetical protein BDA99DRAFT_564396 [Phascolomyces articulosus]|uniref:Uncharacterized protein n=1 Tax=Phascolomyces articulosus TaxID=60185 RepID=A0AAD5JQS4_9FUNG|nr:hypothetical protein BDA99DRAFT_564396 [Phascolomyces articulosus]
MGEGKAGYLCHLAIKLCFVDVFETILQIKEEWKAILEFLFLILNHQVKVSFLQKLKSIGAPGHFAVCMFQFEAEGTRNTRNNSQQLKTIQLKYHRDLEWLKTVDLQREIANYINRRKKEILNKIDNHETSSDSSSNSSSNRRENSTVVFYAPHNNGFVGVAKTSNLKPTTPSTTPSGSSTSAGPLASEAGRKRPVEEGNENEKRGKSQMIDDPVSEFYLDEDKGKQVDRLVNEEEPSQTLHEPNVVRLVASELNIGAPPRTNDDLPVKFYAYKSCVKALTKTTTFSYDSHVNELAPEINADERKCRTQRVQRPGSVLSVIDLLTFGRTHLFSEVKPDTVTNCPNAIDLLRLSRFAKDAIDFS